MSKNNKYIGLTFKSRSCDCSFKVTDYYSLYLDGSGQIRTRLYGVQRQVKECCLNRYSSWKSGKYRTKAYSCRQQIAATLIEESYAGKGRYKLEPLSYMKSKKQ